MLMKNLKSQKEPNVGEIEQGQAHFTFPESQTKGCQTKGNAFKIMRENQNLHFSNQPKTF